MNRTLAKRSEGNGHLMTHHSHPRGSSRRSATLWRALAIGQVLGAATLLLAACGDHTDSLTPGQQAQLKKPLIAYADCMRSHGTSDFPDPSINAAGGVGYPDAQAQTIDRGDPTYQDAQTACESLPGATTAERLLKK